jgi:two-component system sensor histidine kinase CpxA
VQELLFLARLESGNELDRAPVEFDVKDVIREASENAQFEAAQIGKSVEIMRGDSFRISGHPDLMLRAVENILRNGIRFARPAGRVEIECFPSIDGTTGVIRVQDDGPGIPAGMEEAIFEPFVTVSNSSQREELAGCGLGLAITRQAVIAHRGTVIASSASKAGLSVIIEVPLT